MPKSSLKRLAFNRGITDILAGARGDLERLALAAETSINYMPRSLGPMMLRPGWEYIGATEDNERSRSLPFVRSATSMARLEITESGLRVWVDDELVTRPTVTASITNGTFGADVTGWTDADEAGGTSAWLTGGYLSLIGNGTARAIRRQQVTVNEVDEEHALRIIIERGPVTFRVGSSAGADDYITETELGTGEHSLAFTPSGNFHIQFSSSRIAAVLVDSIAVEAAGVMLIAGPWGSGDLSSIRYEQSADVMWIGHKLDGANALQRKIERRGDTSWSLVLYQPEDGPFRLINVTPITIEADGITGDVDLDASTDFFRDGHVGALLRLESQGQLETVELTGADQFSDPIRVIGVGGQRSISILLTGTLAGSTVTLQMSIAAPGSWVDVEEYTTNIAISYNDELDNQEIYYRIGIKAGDYGSGTGDATLVHTSGSTLGIVRVTEVTDGTNATAAVIDTLGAAGEATSDWYEGAWSDYRGYPNVPRLFEGRLFWWGQDKAFGSESDIYEGFDDTVEGDAAPIQRTIGSGPVESVHWVAPLTRQVIGVASMCADVDCGLIFGDAPLEARSSTQDEPLTPTNFNIKRAAASVVYVDQSGIRLFEVGFDVDRQVHSTNDLTLLVPSLNKAGITVLGVQHKPDVRIHCRRQDGSVGVLVFNRAENVICWTEVITQGDVEDVCVLPGDGEDQVYYTVRRQIDGDEVRYHEKWALESECEGNAINRQADSFVVREGTLKTITAVAITGDDLDHTITVTCAGHNRSVGDVIYIDGMLANGDYNLNGRQVVLAVPSSGTFTVEIAEDFYGAPNGFYTSGGTFPGTPSATFSGLEHLEGETVVAWGDGKYLGEFVVDAGEVEFGESVNAAVVGLPYRGRWMSTRNAFGDELRVTVGEPMKLDSVALILHNTHARGIRYGQDFEHLSDIPKNDLPQVAGVPDVDHVFREFEGRPFTIDGEWRTDSRLCIEGYAPMPSCILAAIVGISVRG